MNFRGQLRVIHRRHGHERGRPQVDLLVYLLRRRRRPPSFIALDVVGQDPARRQREAPVSRRRDVVLQQADRDPDEHELLGDGGDGQCERRRQYATNVTSTVSKPRPPNANAKAAPNAFCARSPEPGVRINRLASSKPATNTKNAADVGSVLRYQLGGLHSHTFLASFLREPPP